MKISAKTRYGLASMIFLCDYYESKEVVPLFLISEKLGISKIYLEQVFSCLKKDKLVSSQKGSKGGYSLFDSPKNITLYQILFCLEPSLFEETENTFSENASYFDKVLKNEVYDKINSSVSKPLKYISLYKLWDETKKIKYEDSFMYYL